jgi:hypothetical protein
MLFKNKKSLNFDYKKIVEYKSNYIILQNFSIINKFQLLNYCKIYLFSQLM